jgi:hypothetical protein
VEASAPILGDGSRSGVKGRIGRNDLLKLAIEGHGGAGRCEQIAWFRASASITGAIWSLKGKPGLVGSVLLEDGTRDQRLTITLFPRPGHYTTWEPYGQTIETTDSMPVAERRWRPG